jgi:hypothetical protein
MVIFATGNSLRIATIASKPFIAGICRSIRVMSERCCRVFECFERGGTG